MNLVLRDGLTATERTAAARALVRAVLPRASRLRIDAVTDDHSTPVPSELIARAEREHARYRAGGWWRRLVWREASMMAITLDPRDAADVDLFLSFCVDSIHAEVCVGDGSDERAVVTLHDSGDSIWCSVTDDEMRRASAETAAAGVDLVALLVQPDDGGLGGSNAKRPRRRKPTFDRIRAVGSGRAVWSPPTPYGDYGRRMAVRAARRWLRPHENVLAAGGATFGRSSPWFDFLNGQYEIFHECSVCVTEDALIIVPDLFRRWRAKRIDRGGVELEHVERMRVAGNDVEVLRVRWPGGGIRLKFWIPDEAASVVHALRGATHDLGPSDP